MDDTMLIKTKQIKNAVENKMGNNQEMK